VADSTARYVDRTTNGVTSIEVSFDGASSKKLGSDNPVETNVLIRTLQKSNIHFDSSPWIELSAIRHGSPLMPSGAWNGIKLTEVIDGRVFVGISTELFELDVDTGRKIWSLQTGNTPIYWIMASRNLKGLIVFNGYYQFEHAIRLGNISSISLSGTEDWRTPLPSEDDVFANHPYFEGDLLKSSSWSGFTCTIDQITGEIVDRQFTK